MAQWPRLPRAPITEAILDIHVKLPPTVDLARLAALQEPVRERYPTKRERASFEAGFQILPGGEVQVVPSSGRPDGFLFTSRDGRQVVQYRLDGYTFNRLRPYETWDSFRDEAREHWERYREATSPELVRRIALRYINRLEVPAVAKDFREYLMTVPEVAPSLPQGLSNFLMRLEIPDAESKSIAIVTETMEQPKDDRLGLILDIDVIRQQVFEAAGAQMWEALEQLRDFKNRIFFGSLTKKAMELCR